ncbi:MAG TPA: DivIVA domain-containing protein [Gaiellaceae bacterium]|jgi:cell division initiation protein
MSLTPVEIRHVKIGRKPLGYDRDTTDELLTDIVASFEQVWRERADLRDEMENLEAELGRQKEIEGALRNTLISAERMADDVRTQARREADVIIAEARASARDIVSGAESERERIHNEIRRLRTLEVDVRAEYRAFLMSALDRLEGDTDERQASGQAA